MTSVRQLELVPLPPPPERGKPLVACRVPIEPQVAQRVRAYVIRSAFTKSGWTAKVRDDDLYADWKVRAIGLLAAWWAGKPPIRMWCVGRVVLVTERPRKPVKSVVVDGEELDYQWAWTSGRNPYAGVCDLDNLRKGPLDVLKKAGVIADDRLINEDGGSKVVYAAEGELPCVEVHLWRA